MHIFQSCHYQLSVKWCEWKCIIDYDHLRIMQIILIDHIHILGIGMELPCN